MGKSAQEAGFQKQYLIPVNLKFSFLRDVVGRELLYEVSFSDSFLRVKNGEHK